MEESDRTPRLSTEIYVYATNKSFLNIYDALRIDKVKVEISGYDPATNRQTGHAAAWLDVDDARLVSHLVTQRLFASVTGGTWEKYGGSQREDGSIESRTLQLAWDDAEGRFARNPYRITIANGPGKKTGTGGVAPAGEPTARLSIRLSELDMIKVMLGVGAYIQAYESAHHHRIVAQRTRDLRDKLAGRAAPPAERAAAAPESGRPATQRDAEPARRTAPADGAVSRANLTPLRGRIEDPARREPLKRAG